MCLKFKKLKKGPKLSLYIASLNGFLGFENSRNHLKFDFGDDHFNLIRYVLFMN